jgi:hypothetical protein
MYDGDKVEGKEGGRRMGEGEVREERRRRKL